MSRPKKFRQICNEPSYNSFSPHNCSNDDIVVLFVDEYETIRLLDYEQLDQEECAKRMGVARTTITSIYSSTRHKISDCLINGKQLVIGGGNHCLINNSGKYTFRKYKKIDKEKIMRIAVTYENEEIFQHFGHTENFKIYDAENGQIVSQIVKNTNGQRHGALAGFLLSEKVDVLICGGIGGGAQNALYELGIALYGGVSGNADKAVKDFIDGNNLLI